MIAAIFYAAIVVFAADQLLLPNLSIFETLALLVPVAMPWVALFLVMLEAKPPRRCRVA